MSSRCLRLLAIPFLLPQKYETVKSFTISEVQVFLFLNKNVKDFSFFYIYPLYIYLSCTLLLHSKQQ